MRFDTLTVFTFFFSEFRDDTSSISPILSIFEK